jgi:hypothetical protein
MHISFLGRHITMIFIHLKPRVFISAKSPKAHLGSQSQIPGTEIRQAKLQGSEPRSQSPPVLSQIHKAENALAVAPFLGYLIHDHVSCVGGNVVRSTSLASLRNSKVRVPCSNKYLFYLHDRQVSVYKGLEFPFSNHRILRVASSSLSIHHTTLHPHIKA